VARTFAWLCGRGDMARDEAGAAVVTEAESLALAGAVA
jgi:hypothetical protein